MAGRRYNFILFILFLVAVLWIVQLFLIQVKDVYNLKHLRLRRNSPVKEFINPIRGSIYDRKNELLVTTEKFYQVDIDLTAIEKYLLRNDDDGRTLQEVKEKIAKLSSNITGENYRTLINRLNSKSPILFYNLNEMLLDKLIESFNRNKIPGYITEFIGYKRKYMSEHVASRLIGHVTESRETISNTRINKSKYSIEGETGIEASFNEELSGKFGWKEVIKDAHGNNIPAIGLQSKEVVDGYNIYLTIDSEMQFEVEKILQEKIIEYEAKVGMCTVMDPSTGEIIVMAGFEKDDIGKDPALLRSSSNFPVSYQFEPGSTFKPFTMLGAIDSGVYDPNVGIDCRTYYPDYTGQKKNQERKIVDDHPLDYPLRGEEIIAYSSNVGSAKIAEMLGQEKFYQLLRKTGFGRTVSTKLYGLAKGQISPIYQWSQFSLHSIAFGQEIGVTQLQLANAYCAIANGGELLVPRIIKMITDSKGNLVNASERQVSRRIAKKTSVDTVKNYLGKVFEYGTGKYFNNELLGLAGKTGTAEVKSAKTRGTNKWEYTSTFVGYLPKDDPKYVIVVTFDKPARKYRFAATSALPTFEAVYERLLASEKGVMKFDYQVKNSDMLVMPDLNGLTIEEAEKIISNLDVNYLTNKSNMDAIVNHQYPEPGVMFRKERNKVLFYSTIATNVDSNVLPDFRNSTLRKALEFCISKNIKVDARGKGIIYHQSLAPGTEITDNMKLTIKCH